VLRDGHSTDWTAVLQGEPLLHTLPVIEVSALRQHDCPRLLQVFHADGALLVLLIVDLVVLEGSEGVGTQAGGDRAHFLLESEESLVGHTVNVYWAAIWTTRFQAR